MKFQDIFQEFWEQRDQSKVVFVASCGKNGKPNCAPKMLVDVMKPNKIFFIDYKFTKTFSNLSRNQWVSMSFMNDKLFKGYRLTGRCRIIRSGRDFEKAKKEWGRKLISYEAARMVERIKGGFSSRQAENLLPPDFVLIKFAADEASVIRPDRVLRAHQPQEKNPAHA